MTKFEEQEDDNMTAAPIKDYKEKKSMDAAALGLIQRRVTDSIFPRSMRAKTIKEILAILQVEY